MRIGRYYNFTCVSGVYGVFTRVAIRFDTVTNITYNVR